MRLWASRRRRLATGTGGFVEVARAELCRSSVNKASVVVASARFADIGPRGESIPLSILPPTSLSRANQQAGGSWLDTDIQDARRSISKTVLSLYLGRKERGLDGSG